MSVGSLAGVDTELVSSCQPGWSATCSGGNLMSEDQSEQEGLG